VHEVLSSSGAGFIILDTDKADQFWHELAHASPDLVLLDFTADIYEPDYLLDIISDGRLNVPVIVIVNADEIAWDAINRGAADYLSAGQMARLPLSIRHIQERNHLERERDILLREKNKSEKKLLQATRLYTLLSRINHAIISVGDQESLFNEACHIATHVGGFTIAWIGLIDQQQRTLNIAAGQGIPDKDLHLFQHIHYDEKWPQHYIATTGNTYVCNNVETVFDLAPWREFAASKELGSFIVLPLRENGVIIGTFSLYSTEKNFFSEAEKGLLEKAAREISFRLDLFDKDRVKALTDRRLKDSEIRLKQVHANARIGAWELDFTSNFAEWSEESLRIFGLPLTESRQSYESWLSFIHPDDVDYVLNEIAESRKSLGPFKLRHRIVRRDGSIRHLQSDALFMTDASGQAAGMHGTVLDVTEIIQIQEALRESESRYSTLFHMSPVPGWLYDVETYRIVQVNTAAIEHYGYSEEEFLNMTVWDIRPEEDIPEVMASIWENKSRRHAVHTNKFRHFKKSGELIDVDIYSSALVFNEKTYRLILAIDVTERNSYENRMTSAIIQTQENERNEIGTELHDNICQVLASTLLKLSMLEPSLPVESVMSFRQIRSDITHVTREIRNLSHRLAPASFEDSTLKESIRLLLKTYNVGKSYNIDLQYDFEIDALSLSHNIKLNLYRMLQEQLSNIMKHSDATSVTVSFVFDSGLIRMKISDNGKGCDVRFVRSGMGMANIRRRVQLFSGNIQIASSPGEGYNLIVEIPLNANTDINGRKQSAAGTVTITA
jgi:PAS domain S-box-containing protein